MMRRLRALVCDDDADARRVITTVLECCGFEVSGRAALALEALVMADILSPDLVVLELQLDGMSGLDVLPALRAASPDSAVVGFTNLPALRDDALAAGALEVVDKAGLRGLDRLEETVRLVADTLGISA